MIKKLQAACAASVLLLLAVSSCSSSKPAVEDNPPPIVVADTTPPPPPPPPDIVEPPPPPVELLLKTIYFDFDKYNLKADAKGALSSNAATLRDNPTAKIRIEGHCDERGTAEYNLALGEKRAKSARDYLVDLGINANRIRIISYGEERPAAAGQGETTWAKNRRAEFVRTDL